MLGIFVLSLFMIMGIVQARCLFFDKGSITRFWLGSVMGLAEMMWLPSVFAYALDFTVKAQLAALAAALVITYLFSVIYLKKRPRIRTTGKEIDAGLLMLLLLPAAAVGAYLQYTHSFSVVDGALHVGQSTYGDLSMHAGFATGLIGQSYPPEYTILPGTKLGYPFLVDALSSTMLLFGTSLSNAIFVPGTVMTFLVFMGFALYAWKITKNKSAVAVSFLMFFFSGGLGYFRVIADGVRIDQDALYNALFGYYMTPTNLPDENLRWVNALSDLIVPQRTLMAGWMCLFPALYLLADGIKKMRTKEFLILAVWAGAMPMIHTHSFLALGAISLGALLYSVLLGKKKKKAFMLFALYGLGACAIAAYQLFEWTFPQTMDGGSLKMYFNWVNNTGFTANGTTGFGGMIREALDLIAWPSHGLKDNYFVFWVVNAGLMYVVFPFAAFLSKKPEVKAIALGCLILYVISETVLFQPNEYDNIKLFYVCYLAMLPAGAHRISRILARIQGKVQTGASSALRTAAACALMISFLFVSCISGAVTIARECISDYEIISKTQVKAAEYIKENTEQESVFLTATNHNNAVSVLTGRRIVCGPGMYLYYHGLDYVDREEDVKEMLANPSGNRDLFEKYGVDYVFVSSYERQMGAFDGDFEQLFETVYSDEGAFESIRIYRVADEKNANVKNVN